MNEHTHISDSSPVHVHHKARSAVPTLATIVLRNPFLYGMVPSGGAAGRAHAAGMRVMCMATLHCRELGWRLVTACAPV